MNRRVKAILLTLPLAIDCLANWLFCDGSIKETMSGEAWRQRDSKYWGWTMYFIDNLFWNGHCQEAAMKEAAWGSIWAAWMADLKGG